MPHHTELISTISVALVLAFFGGFVATRLRLPTLVGYLLAGVAVGPFTPGYVADRTLAPQLAEIGVILLMFGVGIHFSIRDLLAVRGVAIPGAVGQSAAATAATIALALWWGWTWQAGLVLGLAISVASTVVLLRALMEHDVLDSVHGRVAVGWLIVEDLFTVVVLVLLPTLAVQSVAEASGGMVAATAGGDVLVTVATTLGKVALLAVVMLIAGARVVPWLLMQVARTGSKELFTLSVLALALGVAFASSSLFGVSLALGAFLAGLVVGESDLSHQAAEDALPLRDAFAVLFFVSVGMLFDPAILLRSPWHVLAVVLIILVAKPLAAFLIVAAIGRPVRTGLIVAAGLAQIGEFSFILAELGLSLGLLPEEGYNLILAGALLSITLNPLMFRLIGPIEGWLRRRPRVLHALQRGGAVAGPADEQAPIPDHGHVVLCGQGRVGRMIAEELERHGVPHLVVDQDRGQVERARRSGTPALHGDAADNATLRHLELDTAKMVMIAISDPIATRHIAEAARRSNPDVPIVARTHSEDERAHLSDEGVEAVLAERELAHSMTQLALGHLSAASQDEQAATRGRTASSGAI
ncbi:MAG: cation:proton antiporter [Chloroflexota bacterium]|nr:cation:proton antiporter [Chloroflexota bacterium]